MTKAIFLDRDGVLNESIKDLKSAEDFKLLPDVGKAVKKINEAGFLAVVVTNQPNVAKGFLSFEELERMHEKLKTELKKEGAYLDDIFVCPHHPEKGFEGEAKELKIDCDCRKPKPGLFIQAINKYEIDPLKSWMIGDSKSDVAAAKAVGIKTVFIPNRGSGSGNEEKLDNIRPDYEKKDLYEAMEFILSYL